MKNAWTAGYPQDTRPVSRQECPFLSVFSMVNNRTCLGHWPVDPVCPRDTRPVSRGFLKSMCPLLSWVVRMKMPLLMWGLSNVSMFWSPLGAYGACTLIAAKNQRKLFLYKVFPEPFGSWTSAPKIVDVRTKKCVFLRPRWWGETFRPLGIRA